ALQKQANVPDSELANSFVVSPPRVPLAGTPSRIRSTLTIFCAGAGIAVVLAVVVDLITVRIRARRNKGVQVDRGLAYTVEPEIKSAAEYGSVAELTPAPEALYMPNKHVSRDVGPTNR
ncbi:MAG: hypothetical protein WA988_01140, partial [Candidatus Nanopelagicales bacterium]